MSQESELLVKCLNAIVFNRKDWLYKDEFSDVDLNIFDSLLHYNKIDLMFYNKLNRFLPEELSYVLKKNYDLKLDRRNKQLKALKAVLDSLTKYNLLLVKGPQLAAILYDKDELRNYNDIDILVKEEDVFSIANELISNFNFKFIIDPIGRRIEYDKPFYQYNSRFHEIRLYRDDIVIEVKRSTSALCESGIENIDFMFDNKITQKIEGDITVDVPNETITFYHLLLNCYVNTFCWYNMRKAKFRDYYEIVLYITQKKNLFKWKDILTISNHNKTNFKIFLVLRELNNIFNQLVSKNILSMFNGGDKNYEEQFLENFSLDVETRFFDVKSKLIRFNNYVKEFYYLSNYMFPIKMASNRIGKFDICIENGILKIKFIINRDMLDGDEKYRFSVWILDDKIVSDEYKPLFKMIYIYFEPRSTQVIYTENNEIMLSGFNESDIHNDVKNYYIPFNVTTIQQNTIVDVDVQINKILNNYSEFKKLFFRTTIEEHVINDIYTIIENPHPILPGIPIVSMLNGEI